MDDFTTDSPPDPGFGIDLPPLPSRGYSSCLVPLDSAAACYLKDLVRESLPSAEIQRIVRFNDAASWRRFQVRKNDISASNLGNANVKLLFHGTRSPLAILGNGLLVDFGFDSRLSAQGAYGVGTYFAGHAAYPVLIHPKVQDDQGTYSLIVAEVTLGCVKDFGDATNCNLTSPPQRDIGGRRYNSVRGTENGIGLVHSSNRHAFGEQFVVYENAQAYPHFLLTISLGLQSSQLDLLRTGNHIALYAKHRRKFLSMGDERLGFKLFGLDETLDAAPLEVWRAWERFLVVGAGDGRIALFCAHHSRFVRMWENGASVDGGPQIGQDELPPWEQWPCERWEPVAAASGKVALYNPHHRCFLRMCDGGVIDGGGGVCQRELAPDWLAELLIVIPHPPPT